MRCSTMHRLGNTLASWTAVRLLGAHPCTGLREDTFAEATFQAHGISAYGL